MRTESWENLSSLVSLTSTRVKVFGDLTDKEEDISVFLRLCAVQLS